MSQQCTPLWPKDTHDVLHGSFSCGGRSGRLDWSLVWLTARPCLVLRLLAAGAGPES